MSKPSSSRSVLKRLAPLLIIAAALALFLALGLQRYFTLDTLRDNREALSAWVDADPMRRLLRSPFRAPAF